MGFLDYLIGTDTPARAKKGTKGTRKATKAKDQARHTFLLHAPVCAPPRAAMDPILKQYGIVKPEWTDLRQLNSAGRLHDGFQFPNEAKPDAPYTVAQRVKLTVNRAQAGWVEYLLHRANFVDVIGGSIDGRNREWASRHNGTMPKPWVLKGCKPKT